MFLVLILERMENEVVIRILGAEPSLRGFIADFCLPHWPQGVKIVYDGGGGAVLDLSEFDRPCRMGAIVDAGYAALRKHARSLDRQSLVIGPYMFDLLQNALVPLEGRAKPLNLTDKEVGILNALHESGAEGVSKKDLLSKVWGYAEGLETHTLETHIYRLRQKIERDPAQPEIIITFKDGYGLSDFLKS